MHTNATSNPTVAVRRRGAARWPVMGLILATSLAAQGQVSPATEALRIYRQAYEAAMLDGTISAEERVLLEALQQAMGLHEDIIDEAVGEAVRPLVPRLNRAGRWTLVAQNMGWGIGLYGWGIPYVLGAEDYKWIVAGEMFSLGAALYLTWKYTADMDLPEGRSQMQRYGSWVGLRMGQTISGLLGLDFREDEFSFERRKGHVALLMAAVPVGAYLGDRLHRRWSLSTGQAYAHGLNGTLTALWLNSLYGRLRPPPERPASDYYSQCSSQNCWQLDNEAERNACYAVENECYGAAEEQYRRENEVWRKEDNDYKKLWRLVELAGYPLGTYLGHRYFGQRSYTFGDALMLYIGAGGGLLYGFLLADLLEVREWETLWLMVTTAGAGGALAMDRYIQGVDYSFGQSALMLLGGIAGGAFGVGVGVLLEADEASFFDFAIIAGSLGGLVLTRRIILPLREGAYRSGRDREPGLSLPLQPVAMRGSMLPGVGLEIRW